MQKIYPKTRTAGTMKVVSEYFKLQPDDIKAHTKKEEIIYPRFIAMYFCYELYKIGPNEIARQFGFEQHGTVINAVNNIRDWITTYPNIKNDICQIKQQLLERVGKPRSFHRQSKLNV